MTRGEIFSVVLPGDFGKPRPGVIVQTDLINLTHPTFLVCPFTSDPMPGNILRPTVEPEPANGLQARSQIMVDKLLAVRREKVRGRIGRLDPGTLAELDRILRIILDLP